MKNFVISLLLASASTHKLITHFADGLNEDEVIATNPSNIQNSVPTCVGQLGEIEGRNCRTNNGSLMQADPEAAEKKKPGPVLPNCIGGGGDDSGKNCRSNGKQFSYPVNPLPYCVGMGGEDPNVNCQNYKPEAGPKAPAAPKAAPAPRPETIRPHFYLPGCDGQYNDNKTQGCGAPAAIRAQQEGDEKPLPLCQGTSLERPGVNCAPPS